MIVYMQNDIIYQHYLLYIWFWEEYFTLFA
jgi:hypothetical protein